MKSGLLLLTLFYFSEFFMQSFWVSVSSWATFDLFLKATHTAAFLFLDFTSSLGIFELDTEDTGDPTDSAFESFLFYLLFTCMTNQYLWLRVLHVNT